MRHPDTERSALHPNDHVDRMRVDRMRPDRRPPGGAVDGTPEAPSRPRPEVPVFGPDTVVVGISGSAASRAALRWARAHTAGTGRHVVAVTAWRSPVQTTPRGARTLVETEERARARAEAAVRDEAPEVPVHVGNGRAAEVLALYSRGAGMLVLGNERPGRLAAPAATVVDCLRLAEVPVVVVPVVPVP